MLDKIPLDLTTIIASAALIAIGSAVLLIIQRLRQRPATGVGTKEDAGVDISSLDSAGPPDTFPRLEFYGTPVRLSVIVVAPCGRGSQLPPPDVLPGLVERLVPGLTEIVAAHHPTVRRWSEQLSAHGFNQAFFNKLPLPGARGKGTPWCSIVGRLSVGERQFLVGMVCTSGSPNSLGQIVVEHEGQWLNTLRVREQEG
jgi:hypothetical protein